MKNLKARIKKIEKEVMKDVTLDVTLDVFLDGLEMAYKKGFTDAINDYGDKEIKGGMRKEEMEEIMSSACKKTRKHFYKELSTLPQQ